MAHTFKVGELVRGKGRLFDVATRGIYEVDRLLPLTNGGSPLYLIKGAAGEEHVVSEREIERA
jgi:hypothetical protein